MRAFGASTDKTGVELSKKGLNLIEMCEVKARGGYVRTDGTKIGRAHESFELKRFRRDLRPLFTEFGVPPVLDHGSGGSNWILAGFDDETRLSAVDYFGLQSVARFQPAPDCKPKSRGRLRCLFRLSRARSYSGCSRGCPRPFLKR